MAGVVCVTRFCESGSGQFKSYVDYMDRDEAVRKDALPEYNLFEDYLDYVGDTRKMGGLFTKEKDSLEADEKEQLKEVFAKAEVNGSNMWQTVISFDNKYLAENGLYDSENDMLDAKRLMNVTRKAVTTMLEKEGLENAVWTASFHYNTDNIHIHIATVEPIPMREKRLYRQYEKDADGKIILTKNPDTGRYEKIPIKDADGNFVYKTGYKGAFKDSTLNGSGGVKSVFVNEIEGNKEEVIAITKIMRDIVKDKREQDLLKDIEFAERMTVLYNQLTNIEDSNGNPVLRNMWNYNQNILSDIRPQIDDLSDFFIETYHKDSMSDLMGKLKEKEAGYRDSYGGDSSYAQNMLKKELYPRLGNAILAELKRFDKLISETGGKILTDKNSEYYNPKEAAVWLEKASQRINNPYLRLRLAKLYMDNDTDVYNPQKGVQVLKELSKMEFIPANTQLGYAYIKGEGVSQDFRKAEQCFKVAADAGDEHAKKVHESIKRRNNDWKQQKLFSNNISRSAIRHLRRSLNRTYEEIMQMQEYAKLQREIEMRGNNMDEMGL